VTRVIIGLIAATFDYGRDEMANKWDQATASW
jgi:hypothetical protein